MKLLHSSDLLVGLSFAHAAPKADQLRAARLEVLRNLLARAKRDKADVILLSGNTFADNRILRREIREVATILGGSSVPIYILPGVTDPSTPDSPFRMSPEIFTSPVHILSEQEPVRLDGATLYPCPVRSRSDQTPDLRWIPPREAADGFRIGMTCCPSLNSTEWQGLDYVAAGGRVTHHQDGRCFWPGAPEATIYGDGKGRAQLVTLTAGAEPVVQAIRVGRMQWLEVDRNVRSVEAIQNEVEEISDLSSALLQMTLRGQLSLEDIESLFEFLADLETKCCHLSLDNRVSISARQEERFRNPVLRAMVANLASQASEVPECNPQQLPTDAESSRWSLLKLTNLISESDRNDLI